MSATVNYLWVCKNQTPDRIDWYLNTLVAAGVDCYAEGSMVFIHPDQWDKAIDALRTKELESIV